jgi:PiT family inorganic phosphate transporter
MLLIFLSSGLFLGWSLGANDAANIFGTAVGTKMVRFKTAAIICGIFVIFGAVIAGAGATHTLGKLGSVNAIAGSFMVALSAGFTVFWMTKLKLPVSTSQAIVGAIIGWNFFTGSETDYNALTKILFTWVACPVLAAIFSITIFSLFKTILNRIRIHLLRIDLFNRTGLILVGAFGAYSLGANNIANVMGVFVPVAPFDEISIFNLFVLSGEQQLFLIGGIAIAIGVYTYSHRVMETVGGSLLKLSPQAALVVVLAQAIVLFLFASQRLENWLITHGLPSIPLVPVSSSQAVIGAVIGIGLLKGGRGIRYKVMGGIAVGWITTPLISGIITFIALFFLQNVFQQEVSRKTVYKITTPLITQLELEGIADSALYKIADKEYNNSTQFKSILRYSTNLDDKQRNTVFRYAQWETFYIEPQLIDEKINPPWFSEAQIASLRQLENSVFNYKWQLLEKLEKLNDEWKLRPDNKLNKLFNEDLRAKQEYLFTTFQVME